LTLWAASDETVPILRRSSPRDSFEANGNIFKVDEIIYFPYIIPVPCSSYARLVFFTTASSMGVSQRGITCRRSVKYGAIQVAQTLYGLDSAASMPINQYV
jgi:hypothetical protein